MSDPTPEPRSRPVGGTEYSWCKAVPIGTGTTVLAYLTSKPPNIPNLQSTLHNLQNSHPILLSTLHFNPSKNTFFYLTSPSPLQIQIFDIPATNRIIESQDSSISDFTKILEHEMNQATWRNPEHPSYADTEVMLASVYAMSEAQWGVFVRLHTSACDRAAAAELLREVLAMAEGENEGIGDGDGGRVNLGIEDLIPEGKASKAFWARGLDMIGYSLNSFRLANLEFQDADSARCSQVMRFKMNADHSRKLLHGCKLREIKHCAALTAAAMIAARCSKDLPAHQKEKYAAVTLIDCRPFLDPALTTRHYGFYHSAILNTHDVSAEDTLWEVAKRSYSAFSSAKANNKHFTDMADLNFLMCKAIENPGLTPSASLRTALISVFEDPVVDVSSPARDQLGLDDYTGCASVHGVGPSIAIFDTVRDGQLDCVFVYPSPLFSRGQMNHLVEEIERILVSAIEDVEGDET